MERIEDLLKAKLEEATGVEWIREYRPCPTRRWKIDLSLPDIKLAVEIEGRFHGRAKQHVSDCEKNNYLEANGWTCLRYPASRVKANNRRAAIAEQICRVMCGVNDSDLEDSVLTGVL